MPESTVVFYAGVKTNELGTKSELAYWSDLCFIDF